jgi:SAM-dependent methyltransferase
LAYSKAHFLVSDFYYEHYGFCPICQAPAKYVARSFWFRDHYFCQGCGSLPRQRALMLVLESVVPTWRNLSIYEASPAGPASDCIARSCSRYVSTFCYPNVARGTMHDGFRCEDLEALTFPDDQFDIVITQEVFEHIFDYRRAFREVMRTLKSGGVHVFTTPKYKGLAKTVDRAIRQANGQIAHLFEPQYHGNPIDNAGSLVTVHYGDDISEIIWNETRCPTSIYVIHDEKAGATAEFMDVFVTRKL